MPDPTNHRSTATEKAANGAAPAEQPEPEASSDGDGSWTAEPQTQDPDEDRSVDAVIRRTSGAD